MHARSGFRGSDSDIIHHLTETGGNESNYRVLSSLSLATKTMDESRTCLSFNAGFALPGVAFALSGRSDRIAWLPVDLDDEENGSIERITALKEQAKREGVNPENEDEFHLWTLELMQRLERDQPTQPVSDPLGDEFDQLFERMEFKSTA